MTSPLNPWPLLVPTVIATLLRPAAPPPAATPYEPPPVPVSASRTIRVAPAERAAWPLSPEPQVVAQFDPPAQTWTAGHRGVDLLGSPGQPVRSAIAGTISFVGTIAGRGVVVVTSGGRRTTYEPVASGRHRGDPVAAGDTIGTLQAGPSHCAPRSCLHWGLIEGERYLDPLSLLGRGPVRLLPLLTPSGAPGGTPSAGDRW